MTSLLDGSATGREIAQQPVIWRQAAALVDAQRPEVDRVVGEAIADPRCRVVLTGAGTSAFAGRILAPDLSRRLGRQVEAIATTDIVADPRAVMVDDRPVLLVSLARSGDSPESVAAVDLVTRLAPATRHLVVTCHADGALARTVAARTGDAKDAAVVVLPAAAHDRGFAMTSSLTGMLVAVARCFVPTLDVEALAAAGEAVLARAEEIADAFVDLAPGRVVHLGSGALAGLAAESALKCLELTAGRLIALADTSMGFRHGPKAVLDASTVAVVALSGDPEVRPYDLDITRELAATLGSARVLVVADPDEPDLPDGVGVWPVPRPRDTPDGFWAVAAVLPAQLAALAASRAAGLTPDNPFPAGEVNRVVRGVVVHPLQHRDGS